MKQNRNEIEKIINEIKEDELRKFLVNEMINSNDIYDLFRRNFVNYFPRLTYKEYEKKIYEAINRCCDKYGFITYSNAKIDQIWLKCLEI